MLVNVSVLSFTEEADQCQVAGLGVPNRMDMVEWAPLEVTPEVDHDHDRRSLHVVHNNIHADTGDYTG